MLKPVLTSLNNIQPHVISAICSWHSSLLREEAPGLYKATPDTLPHQLLWVCVIHESKRLSLCKSAQTGIRNASCHCSAMFLTAVVSRTLRALKYRVLCLMSRWGRGD